MTYIISSVRETGTITYHCSTAQTALEKVQDFRRAEYRDITVASGDAGNAENALLAMLDAGANEFTQQ